MDPIRKGTYCLDNIPACCKNPKVTWGPQPGVLISCPPGSKCLDLSFIDPVSADDKKCIWVFIECGECGVDRIIEKRICFCTTDANCGPCENCGPAGVCIHRCPDGVCDPVTDTCGECGPDKPCTGGKVCVGGKCQCPPSKPFEINGRCTECAGQGDCEAKYGKCYICSPDGGCVYKGDCGGGGVCDPRTGNCEECVTESDCLKKGDNFCCSAGKKCVCCPGFVLNPVTGKCDKAPDCTGIPGECGPCGVCKDKRCVPRQCPDGQICIVGPDGNPICADKCDCNNPASCNNEGKICKNINGICACISCGAGCTSGCISGCHCEPGNRCVVDKCNGSCKDGGGCGGGSGTGCGCLVEKCVECAKLSCLTGECDKALGCECDAQKNCVHTGKKCVGGCDTTGECGAGCTCNQERKKCEPCEFFDCPNGDCAKQEGCKCGGSGNCEGDPDYKCPDSLTIEKEDSTCDIIGKLKKDRDCSCPLISTLLSSAMVSSTAGTGQTSGTHKVKFKAGLYFGNNVNDPNWLINNTANPEISINETANGGSLRLDIITNFQPISGVQPSPLTVTLTAPISGKGEIEMGDASLYQMNGLPISSGDPLEKRIVSSVTFSLRAEGWAFQNTCTYPNKEIGVFEVISNTGYGSVRIQNGVTTTATRNPKFIWYKSNKGVFDLSTWIKTVYVAQDSSGLYIDRLHDEVINGVKLVESCFDYGLKTDCSCKPLVSQRIVFCKPPDFTAELDATSCGRTVNVSIDKTCHANKNKTYELVINGSVRWFGGLFTSGHSGRYTENAGITSVTLRMVCGDKYECVVTKTFKPPVPPDVRPDEECAEGGLKVRYTFWKNKYTPTFVAIIFRVKGSTPVFPEVDDAEKISFLVDPYVEGQTGGIYEYKVIFQCGDSPIRELKKNCCEFYAPKTKGDHCNGARYWDKLKDGVTYKIGPVGSASYGISKTDLAGMDLNKSFKFTPINSGAGEITLTPAQHNSVSWSTAGGCSGTVNAILCGGFVFGPVEVPLPTPTGKVPPGTIFPPTEEGESYQIKVNGGAFVPYVPGTNFAAVYGINTIQLKKGDITETRTLEIRAAADCDIEDADLVVGQNGSKYEVMVPTANCPCAPILVAPFSFKKITKMGDFFRVEFYSIFENDNTSPFYGVHEIGPGTNPIIASGVLKVTAPGFSTSINVANTNKIEGYVDIPCKDKPANTYNLSYTLERVKNGNNGTTYGTDKFALLRLCLGWPLSLGTTIAGISLVNLTNSQLVEGISLNSVCFTFGQVDLTGGANLKFIVLLSDGTVFTLNALDILFPTGDDVSFIYGDDEKVCGNCLDWVRLGFSATLVNGCSYTDSGSDIWTLADPFNDVFCHGATEIIQAPLLNLVPGDTGKIKVGFYEDGVLIKREYIDGGLDKAILDGTQPSNIDGIEYGKTYLVDADCVCVGEKTLPCLKPIISGATFSCISGETYSDASSALRLTYTIASAYPGQLLYLYNADGDLLDTVTTNAVTGAVTARTVDLTEAQAGLVDDVVIYAQFDANCKSDNKTVVRGTLELTWTRDCTDSPFTYDLIFAGGAALSIVSGIGTVVANKIVSIPNNTQIVFKGTLSGCVSQEYTVQEDCTVEPTPSVSVSATRSVPTTPSMTKSITPSLSVSKSRGIGIVILSKTPSVTKFATPSITPSISESPSEGTTPSVTKSISITRSITPSISISQTSNTTPSITPSVSKSVTPSVPVSITPTVSRSTSAPVCDNNGCQCCIDGVLYDRISNITLDVTGQSGTYPNLHMTAFNWAFVGSACDDHDFVTIKFVYPGGNYYVDFATTGNSGSWTGDQNFGTGITQVILELITTLSPTSSLTCLYDVPLS